jgi:hypothetical protein
LDGREVRRIAPGISILRLPNSTTIHQTASVDAGVGEIVHSKETLIASLEMTVCVRRAHVLAGLCLGVDLPRSEPEAEPLLLRKNPNWKRITLLGYRF